MQIARDSWHFKRHQWWQKNKYGYNTNSTHYNLCPYVRAVLFGYIIRKLFCDGWKKRTGVIATVFILLNLYVNSKFGSGLVHFELYFLMIAIASTIVTVIVEAISRWRSERQITKIKSDKATTWKLAKLYVKSWHDKVCPLIEVEPLKKETK